MKNFNKVLKSVYKILNRLFLFRNILSVIILFLSCYLAFMVIDLFIPLSPLWAILPAAVYFFYTTSTDLSAKVNNKKLVLIEKAYPDLDEKLRTAADNIFMENPVVEELQEEVFSDLKKVRASSFFDLKNTNKKLFIIAVICLLIVSLAAFNFKLMDWGIITPRDPRILIGSASDQPSETDDLSASDAENPDLFGEDSIGELGDEDIFLSINSLSFELTNVRSEEELPQNEFQEKFPDAVDLLQDCDADCVHQNNIPIEQQELVKNYFINLAES
jgi:hypothetical protein